MTNKKEQTSAKKGRVKVPKLRLNKETVKDLTDSETKKVKGGFVISDACKTDIRAVKGNFVGQSNAGDPICD